MSKPLILIRALLLAGLLVALVGPEPLMAQCSMCRAALEQNADAARSFNRAILFLLGVPYLLFGSIALLYLRSRRRSARPVASMPVDATAAVAE